MAVTQQPALSVELAPHHSRGLRLRNPVMIASGTFGYDGYGRGLSRDPASPEMARFQELGAVVAKTATMRPRVGNPEPRWHPQSWRRAVEEGEFVLLNSVGLTNPGLEAILREHAPVWATWEVPVLASIAGETVEQFGLMASMVEGTPGIVGLELNLSCPNTQNGAYFALDPQVTLETVQEVRSRASLPLIAKLAPNVPDIAPIAQAAEAGGADAITVCNTMPALGIDVETRQPLLGAGAGGISGPGLHPIAVALVYRAAQAVSIPIIGVGGVFTAQHAIEFLLAGATAVQVGSANLASLIAPMNVLDGIVAYMCEHRVGDVNDLVGAVQMPGST